MDYNESSKSVLATYFDVFLKNTSEALREGVRDIETGAVRSLALVSPAMNITLGYTNPKYLSHVST